MMVNSVQSMAIRFVVLIVTMATGCGEPPGPDAVPAQSKLGLTSEALSRKTAIPEVAFVEPGTRLHGEDS
jgi:hypothetical protein